CTIIEDQGGQLGLLVERFDRYYDVKKKHVNKIHQEDACQFLNRYPADKYRLSYREIAEGMERWCTAPIPEISQFIRLIIYSYLIGNGDLHAKNISLYVDSKSNTVQFTKAYDLVSTFVYGDNNMALHLEGKKNNLRKKYFIQFAKRFGLNSLVINNIIDEVSSVLLKNLQNVDQIGFDNNKSKLLKNEISKRLEDLS
ncbi:hypothetical protein BVY03_04380, partial [bacterium K02(2017)]